MGGERGGETSKKYFRPSPPYVDDWRLATTPASTVQARYTATMARSTGDRCTSDGMMVVSGGGGGAGGNFFMDDTHAHDFTMMDSSEGVKIELECRSIDNFEFPVSK